MTSQHKTGTHPFYIGMYIHIYTHIYVHIYTSQKECLSIFSRWGLIHVQIEAWSHWVACVFRSLKACFHKYETEVRRFRSTSQYFLRPPLQGWEWKGRKLSEASSWPMAIQCYSFTWAIYWAIPKMLMQMFQPWGITSLPWALKPIIGLVSDMFPLGTGLGSAFMCR